MNLYKLRWLIPSPFWGKSYRFIRWLQKQKPFKGTHFDIVMPDRFASKTILCFGQIHTVQRGRLDRKTALSIARVQARLFTYYTFLHETDIIETFGVEGLTDIHGDGDLYFGQHDVFMKHLLEKEITQLQRKGRDFKVVKKIFFRLAKKWCNLLKQYPNRPEVVSHLSSLIDGLRMLSLFDPKLRIYPIEGEQEYRSVANMVHEYQDKIHQLELDSRFQRAEKKNFKQLTQDEYFAAHERAQWVKRLNRVLKDPIREDAHIKLALRKLHNHELTAFVMGIGHRKNLIHSANQLLPDKNTAFVLITPQELYGGGLVKKTLRWLVLLVLLGGGAFVLFDWMDLNASIGGFNLEDWIVATFGRLLDLLF